MWEAAIWTAFGCLFAIGYGAMSLTPPAYLISRCCFLLSLLILIGRLGWWLVFEHSGNKIWTTVLAFVIFGCIGVLWAYSMQWVNEREIAWNNNLGPQQPQIVEQPKPPNPLLGNLKQRANELSKEILVDLYDHGWPMQIAPTNRPRFQDKMPIGGEENRKWSERRSGAFMFSYLERVLDTRDEFEQLLHVKDKYLEMYIQQIRNIDGTNKQRAKTSLEQEFKYHISPQIIEDIAGRLKIMADEYIKD